MHVQVFCEPPGHLVGLKYSPARPVGHRELLHVHGAFNFNTSKVSLQWLLHTYLKNIYSTYLSMYFGQCEFS